MPGVKRMKQIKFYGIGGQGVVTAAKVLSIAASLHEGKYAITVPAYGHERRGAPVFTDIIIDETPILLNCFVYEPDIVVVMDETIIEKKVNIPVGNNENYILVLNTGKKEIAEHYCYLFGFRDVYWTDATHIAMEHIGSNTPNSSILGGIAKTGVVLIESIESALKEYFGIKAGAKNANAARTAYEAIEKA